MAKIILECKILGPNKINDIILASMTFLFDRISYIIYSCFTIIVF